MRPTDDSPSMLVYGQISSVASIRLHGSKLRMLRYACRMLRLSNKVGREAADLFSVENVNRS